MNTNHATTKRMNVIQPTHAPGSLGSQKLVAALNPGAGQSFHALEQNSEGSDLEKLAPASLQSIAASVSLECKGRRNAKEEALRLPFPGTNLTLKEKRSKAGRPKGSGTRRNTNSTGTVIPNLRTDATP